MRVHSHKALRISLKFAFLWRYFHDLNTHVFKNVILLHAHPSSLLILSGLPCPQALVWGSRPLPPPQLSVYTHTGVQAQSTGWENLGASLSMRVWVALLAKGWIQLAPESDPSLLGLPPHVQLCETGTWQKTGALLWEVTDTWKEGRGREKSTWWNNMLPPHYPSNQMSASLVFYLFLEFLNKE